MIMFLGIVLAVVAVFILLSIVLNKFKNNQVNRRVYTVKDDNLDLQRGQYEQEKIIFEDECDNEALDIQQSQKDKLFNLPEDYLKEENVSFDEIEDVTVEDSNVDKLGVAEVENNIDMVEFTNNTISLYLVRRNNTSFVGEELYKALTVENIFFGDLNIFHYFKIETKAKRHVFSVAQATSPGDFDINNFSYSMYQGLCFIMNNHYNQQSKEDLILMLEKAQNIAKSLDGILLDPSHKPLVDKLSIKNFYNKSFFAKTKSLLDNY